MDRTGPLKENSPVCWGALYWLLVAGVCAVPVVLSLWVVSPRVPILSSTLPALLFIALLVWFFHLASLPSLGSIWVRCSLPIPVIWLMLAAATGAFFSERCFPHQGGASGISAAIVAAALALVGYSLLLPRLLARRALARSARGLRSFIANESTESTSGTQAVPALATGPETDMSISGNSPIPWVAPVNDPEREERLFRWLAVPENPIESVSDDLFDVKQKATRLLEMLRPASPMAGAGTVNIVGPRGSGKSSLLRLAAQINSSAQFGENASSSVALRFCFLSLWEYSNSKAALRGAIDKLLQTIRDRIDILPIAGISNGIIRAVFGGTNVIAISEGIVPPSLDIWLPALSELLVGAGLRIVFCVEDDDRTATAARRADHCEIMQGFLDRLKSLPGFGYVICTSTPVWSEPSPDDPRLVSQTEESNGTRNWSDYNDRWKTACQGGELDTMKAPPMNQSEISGLRAEVRIMILDGRSSWAERTSYLPVSRLCQFDLLLENQLETADLEAILRVFRTWMVRQVCPDTRDIAMKVRLCGIETQQRQGLLKAFLSDRSGIGLPQHITPRTLRNALRQASRHWTNIVASLKQGGNGWQDRWVESGIDFDSVLVACFLRACLPDRWPSFLLSGGNQTLYTSFHRNLAEHRPGGPEANSMLHGEVVKQLHGLPLWLGLSGSVWNMLAVQEFTQGSNVRPGGIIGNGAQTNWNLFINS